MKSNPAIIAIAILWTIFGIIPVAYFFSPMPTENWFNAHPACQFLGMNVLVTSLAAVTLLLLRADSGSDREKVIRYCGFALLSLLLTDIHYDQVDRFHMNWQLDQFNSTFLHTSLPPYTYRFLAEGTLWWMTLVTGDFQFGYEIYRLFFTFLLCLAIYRLARLYLPSAHSILVVFVYSAFYTLSTRYYFGNLFDPMSHLVILTALYYCQQRQFWSFFWLLVLGIFVKETMILLVPCYYLMNLENTRLFEKRNLQQTVLLSVGGLMAFFACRVPFHFSFDYETINRIPESMIWTNLGIGHPKMGSPVSIYMRYAHPFLFIFMWLPVVIWGRRRLPVPLFWTCIYFTTTLYISNLIFAWNYESRNFVPGLVVLVICTFVVLKDWAAENPAVGRS